MLDDFVSMCRHCDAVREADTNDMVKLALENEMPITREDDPRPLQIAQRALLETQALARARGLSEEEIDREADDDDSQYWEDACNIIVRLRDELEVH